MDTRAFWKSWSCNLVLQEPSVWTFPENDNWTKPERSKVEARKICFPCTTKNTYELKKVKKRNVKESFYEKGLEKSRELQFSDPMFENLSKLEKKFWMQRFKSMNTMLDQHYHEWLLYTVRLEVEQVVEHRFESHYAIFYQLLWKDIRGKWLGMYHVKMHSKDECANRLTTNLASDHLPSLGTFEAPWKLRPAS